jgi:hypothetical protein
MTKNSRRPDSADESILKLARALGREAAREDYAREKEDWRKKPRKRILRPPQNRKINEPSHPRPTQSEQAES